ncbi:MAG: hypothetical protein JJ896_16300 [Rhodothermales bacterium]|nr:hypothetical protein [Rhodothermales bacterium]MBO6781218.1 hypothetical protein [Rhodothermales bacterium]
MQETLHVNLSMNKEVTRIDQPCTIRLCFDGDGTACVRIIKQNGDVVEIPVFRSINFAKELVV